VVKEKELGKRFIEIKQLVFSSEAAYKVIKQKIEELGYTFIEKEHEKKDTKYGYEINFKFTGLKKYDDFAKGQIEIDAKFFNLNKFKDREKGDVSIKFEAKVLTDYKNEWNITKFKKALFALYNTYFIAGRNKKMYFIPTTEDMDEIYNAAKEKLELYRY
jgi:hypothetical protein